MRVEPKSRPVIKFSNANETTPNSVCVASPLILGKFLFFFSFKFVVKMMLFVSFIQQFLGFI